MRAGSRFMCSLRKMYGKTRVSASGDCAGVTQFSVHAHGMCVRFTSEAPGEAREYTAPEGGGVGAAAHCKLTFLNAMPHVD